LATAQKKQQGLTEVFGTQGELALAGGVMGLLAIMIVPMPALALDMLLATSWSIALLILLVTLYIRKPLDFSVFPTLLLVTTMFRLALNVASTRRILLSGQEGVGAAGRIIEVFGQMVVGGNYAVGLVVFSILVLINFIVITKGAGRVAEVSARFTLDAMPGKQMAIDAELNAGHIDEKTARARRSEIAREADFFGSMDGASKFIRGDAIAGIVIVLVNIVGGVFIGVVQQDLSLSVAASNYTILTIGDGLVGQIPALVISAAAGMLVTRVPDEHGDTLEGQFGDQLLGNPKVLAMLAAALFCFAAVPGLRVPFIVLGAGAGYGALQVLRRPEEAEKKKAATEAEPKARRAVRPEDLLAVQPLSVVAGVDLVYLMDARKGGELIERIQRVRNQFAEDLGVVLPQVHLRDDMRQDSGEYRVLLRGEVVGKGTVHARKHLAINPGTATGKLKGIETIDPVFGLPAVWIPDSQMIRAQSKGYTVVDVPTVITTHFTELMHRHAHELFDISQLCTTLERVQQVHPRLVEDLVPEQLSRQTVLSVMRNLVREGLSTRDVQSVLEALADYAPRTQNAEVLTEFVRQRLARHISHRFTDDDGVLHYLGLGPDVEQAITRGLSGKDGAMSLVLAPDQARVLLENLRRKVDGYADSDHLVVLCPPLARGPFRRFLEKVLPQVPVLSPAELVPSVRLEKVGTVTLKPGRRS